MDRDCSSRMTSLEWTPVVRWSRDDQVERSNTLEAFAAWACRAPGCLKRPETALFALRSSRRRCEMLHDSRSSIADWRRWMDESGGELSLWNSVSSCFMCSTRLGVHFSGCLCPTTQLPSSSIAESADRLPEVLALGASSAAARWRSRSLPPRSCVRTTLL